MPTRRYNFASEYTDAPGGRYVNQGPFSGEHFRETVLKPALAGNDSIELNLTGVFLLAPSFIDEAFGIIVEHLGYDVVNEKLIITVADDPMLEQKIRNTMLEHRGKKSMP